MTTSNAILSKWTLPFRFRKKPILALSLVTVALGLTWYWQRHSHQVPSGTTIEFKVIRGTLIQKTTIPGTVVPRRKTIITPPFNGYIKSIAVSIGQIVKPGTPLLTLTPSLIGVDEDLYPIRSPIHGTVVQILRSEGEYVDMNPLTGLIRIDDLSQLMVEATAPEFDIVKIQKGQEALIKTASIGDRTFRATITDTFMASKEQSRWERAKVEYPVILKMLEADPRIKPGMSVIVDVITQKYDNTLMVRHEYIGRKDGKIFVILGSGLQQEVQVGAQNDEWVSILSGVNEGQVLRPATQTQWY